MHDSPTVVPLPLGYHAAPHADPHRHRKWRVASLLVMIPAIVVPFVPFACNITPAHAAVAAPAAWVGGEDLDRDDVVLWLSLLPFLLAFPICYWKVRQLVAPGRRPPGSGERLALMLVGATFAVPVIGVVVLLASHADEAEEIGLVAAEAAVLLLAVGVFVRLTATGADPDARVSVALLGPYAANAAFNLVVWATAAQLGWFLTLAPAAATLAELCALAALAIRRRRMT